MTHHSVQFDPPSPPPPLPPSQLGEKVSITLHVSGVIINKSFQIADAARNNRSQKCLRTVRALFTHRGRTLAQSRLYTHGNRAHPWTEVDTRVCSRRTYVCIRGAFVFAALCTFISRCVTSKIDAQFVSASKDAVLQIGNLQIEPLLVNRLKKWPAARVT